MPELRELLSVSRLLPVVTVHSAEQAVRVATLLEEQGIRIMELTLRTPVALAAITAVRARRPDFIVGAGTILDRDQLLASRRAGAQFAVSPGLDPHMLESAASHGIPLMPAVMTPGEAMQARSRGYQILKLFPASVAGGCEWLRAVSGPMPGLSFCPTGGITAENAGEYLSQANVVCVGASWVAPMQLVRDENWGEISARIAAAAALISHSC